MKDFLSMICERIVSQNSDKISDILTQTKFSLQKWILIIPILILTNFQSIVIQVEIAIKNYLKKFIIVYRINDSIFITHSRMIKQVILSQIA